MVAVIPQIPEPPIPTDAPAVFSQKASDAFEGLYLAIPKINEFGKDIEDIGAAADTAMRSAQADSDAALGFRNEANAAKVASQSASAASASAQAASGQAAVEAAESAAQAAGYAGSMAQAIAMAATFTAVPTTFQAACIVVTQPHLRCMVWNGTKYIRAPWHPVGQVVYSYGATLSGALPIRADLSYNQSDYPDLAAYLGLSGTGTFSLIEARGEFLRVLDNGRGKDVGRVIRSGQADATREHTHGLNYNGIDNSNGYGGFRLTANVEGSSANTLGISGGGGTETRPSNIALPLWLTY